MCGSVSLDQLVVFGQGPVKAVLFPHELSTDQRATWSEFRSNPLVREEPTLYVIEGRRFVSQLTSIRERSDITSEKREALVARYRSELQNLGRFALGRMGRQNALAAGALLLEGVTREVILSG